MITFEKDNMADDPVRVYGLVGAYKKLPLAI